MTSPEFDILLRLIDRLDRLQVSVASDLTWMEWPPVDLSEFETMASHRQSAARAVLKSFEQIEDQLARAFRVIPKLLGEDTQRWFARDYADYFERLGILDEAATWSAVVRLRNELVHDYPLDAHIQFERFSQVIGHIPLLAKTHRRLTAFVSDELPGKMP